VRKTNPSRRLEAASCGTQNQTHLLDHPVTPEYFAWTHHSRLTVRHGSYVLKLESDELPAHKVAIIPLPFRLSSQALKPSYIRFTHFTVRHWVQCKQSSAFVTVISAAGHLDARMPSVVPCDSVKDRLRLSEYITSCTEIYEQGQRESSEPVPWSGEPGSMPPKLCCGRESVAIIIKQPRSPCRTCVESTTPVRRNWPLNRKTNTQNTQIYPKTNESTTY